MNLAAGFSASNAVERNQARWATSIVAALSGALFAAPFVWPVHRPPQPAFDVEWLAATIASLLALAICALRPFPVRLRWPLPSWLAAFLLIAAWHHASGTMHYAEQLYYAFVYAACIAATYWVGRALSSANLEGPVMRAIAWAMIAGAGFSVFIQCLQMADVKGLPWWLYFEIIDPAARTRPLGNVGQPNVLSTYLAWAGIGALYLLSEKRLRPWSAAVAVAVFAFGIAVTRSRMGALFGLLLVLACWLPWALRPSELRSRLGVSAAVGIGLLLGSLAIQMLVPYEGSRVASALGRFTEGTIPLRTVMWHDAWKVAATSPWLGVGFGDYGAAQYWIAAPGPYLQPTAYVHNIVLQIAAEMGWPLAAALVALAAWWGCAQLRARLSGPGSAMAIGMMALIAIHSMLEWPLWSLSFALPVALLFALGEPRAQRGSVAVGSRLLAPVGAAGLLLATLLLVEFDEMSRAWMEVDAARAQRRPVAEATLINVLALAEASRVKPFAERLYSFMRPLHAIEPSPAEIAMHERLLWQGADPRVIARLVVLYARAGRVDDSLKHAERLAVFFPEAISNGRQQMLSAIEDVGSEADPLRAYLNSAAASFATPPRGR